ncbi:MAG: 50S ribosomal protein L30 [Spirochaetes bacterium RBG_16_49_21]|nr:MAG: 50S ribosomal protein L30 [Spirochaetes bacterium RBG_16_49_21]
MARKIIIRQIKSGIGTKPKQRATLKALGLRKINAERLHDDTPVIRGMIDKVSHLISIKEVDQ